MNAQEIFDRVARHLLKQGERSSTSPGPEGSCLYRKGELRCAIGCLISDDVYKPSLEYQTAEMLPIKWALSESIGELEVSSDFLTTLQQIHDVRPVESWHNELRRFAENQGLRMPPMTMLGP